MRRQFVPSAIKPPHSASSYSSYSSAAIPALPGLRTSAGERLNAFPLICANKTFFSSLGANLRITDDDLNHPSPLNTPSLRPCDLMPLPTNSPLASLSATSEDISKINDNELSAGKAQGEAAPVDPLAGIPELNSYIAESEEDQVAGLKLVADSVAQQRQIVSSVLIFHPLCLAVFSVVLALSAQWIYRDRSDLGRVLTTWAGLVMAYLLLVRLVTKDYITYAEDINWNWLDGDKLIVTKFGDEIIGALVLGWIAGEGRGSRRKRVGRGLIRAWTVKLRYRGKGVGTGLLEEAVGIVNEKVGDGIDFAEEHANSKRVLKPYFNKSFDKRDIRAQEALDEVARQKGSFVKRGSR